MEEMMEDVLDMEEDETLDEEADQEVDKVLFELTNGKLGLAGPAGTELPVSFLLPLHRLTSHLYISQWRTSWKKRRQKETWRSIGSN